MKPTLQKFQKSLRVFWVFLAFILSHCSTKHQLRTFTPFYSEGPDASSLGRVIKEKKKLAAQESLTVLEKKRFLDLMGSEENAGSEQSVPYHQMLQTYQQELEPVYEETDKVKMEVISALIPNSQNESIDFSDSTVKRKFQEILKIWSRDENEKALEMAKELLASSSNLNSKEKLKLTNLKFRIAIDLGHTEETETTWESLRQIEPCAAETSQATFLVALKQYTNGKITKAKTQLQSLCDTEWKNSNLGRRRYWERRMGVVQEANPTTLFPGFYDFVLGQYTDTKVPPILLEEGEYKMRTIAEIEVPSLVAKDLINAENRLSVGLRADANWYLIRAGKVLRSDLKGNWRSLLYIASLHRAAGIHIESMKILNDLMNLSDWRPEEAKEIFASYLRDFPRPFEEKVNWLSKTWGVDSDLVYSLMRQESAFNPLATSIADARGLLQMMPVLAKSLSQGWGYQPVSIPESVLYRVDENLKLSIFHLHQLSRAYQHPLLIAAAYNAGIQRVNRWLERFGNLPPDVFIEMIPVNETRNYVKLVLRNLAIYKALRNGGVVPTQILPEKMPVSLHS